MSKCSLGWFGILFLVLTTGCGGQKDEGQEQAFSEAGEPAAERSAAIVDKATAGSISGRVLFSGSAPAMQPIDVSSEASCHTESDPVYSEHVIVNDNGTLRNVFVYVKDGLGDLKFPPPSAPVELDQVGCQYQPHLFGIQVGQPLKIKNSDEGVLHNVHALSSQRNGFNFGMPKVMESVKKFKKPEVMVKIKCDVHGWMNSYAGVVDHPYYAVTGADGTFDLSPLPPGEYVIESWHEEYGTQTETVTVTAQGKEEISFTFTAAS